MIRLLLCTFLVTGLVGCETTAAQCSMWASVAKELAIEIAAQEDPDTPEALAARERYAAIGLLAATAGCAYLDDAPE